MLMKNRKGVWVAGVLALCLQPVWSEAKPERQVVVYSARNEQLIRPVFEAYNKATGVQIEFVTDKEGPLLARLKSEGENTPADLLLTVDAGNLWQAAQEGLLQPVESSSLAEHVPAHLRDPGNQWFGLSVRARTVFYNPTLVKPQELSTYQALADEKWAGKLCLRTAKKVYNQSLVAMMIAAEGEAATEKVIKGWVKNLAAPPFSDDTALLEAIAAGQCAVGIANTYYFGRLQKDRPDIPVKVFWPNQPADPKQQAAIDGVHVNISGAGVTRHAKHAKEAIKLLEWMASSKAQSLFADDNMEYPVNPDVKPAATVSAWGDFLPSVVNLNQAGELQVKAVQLMDRAGYQ